jgi:biopolymer transport protein ExbD
VTEIPAPAKPTKGEPSTRPQTSKELVPSGPVLLTLTAKGAVLAPDGKPLDSREEVEALLKQERSRVKEPRTVFRAEKETDILKVRNALALYRKAGFQEVELQEAGHPDKKGPILTLPEPPEVSKDSDKPSIDRDDLAFPTKFRVIVHSNQSGSQAGQVRDIVFRSPTEETAFPRGKWREELPKKFKAEIAAQNATDQDEVQIVADLKLTYGGFLEVVEACSSAGMKKIELAVPGVKSPRKE